MSNLNAILKLSAGILTLLWGGLMACGRASVPPASPSDYGFATPIPAPAMPTEMDLFTPPLLGNSSGPAVAEFTRTAGPDETVTVAGPDFTKATRFRFYGQTNEHDAVTMEREPHVLHPIAASVILPDKLPAWSTYLMWPRNGSADGMPVAINRTEAWWIGGDEALAGETVSVYGRNLSHNNGTASSWIYLKRPENAAGEWIKPTAVNPYCVNFQVPALNEGTYAVWAHNGHGGAFGWSGPLTLTVLSKSPWPTPDAPLFSVKSFGAKGDGITDDTAFIQSALQAAAKAAPATLYFPAGNYLVNGQIELQSNVSWLGDDRDTTAIKVGPAFKSTVGQWWQALINSDSPEIGHIEFKNLSFEGNGNLGPKKSLMVFRHHDYLKLTGCRFNWKGSPNTFNVGSNNHVIVSHCEFIGDQVFLGDSRHVEVRDCDFRLTDFANAALISWGGSEVAIVNNRAQDYDPAGARADSVGSGRFFVAQSHPDSNRDFYIADNVTRNMAPPVNVGDSNQGEQILLEVGNSSFVEPPAAATASNVTFARALPVSPSQEAVILAGRGTGQFRHVTSVKGNAITVTPDWSVLPDKTSLIGVGAAQSRTVVYHNQLDGKRDYPTYETASVALSMYGNVSDTIFAENKITNMRTGLADEFSQVPGDSQPVPCAIFFNLIAHNKVDGAYCGTRVITNFLTNKSDGTWGHLGNTYRGNELTDVTRYGLYFEADQSGFPGGAMEQDVFEHNSIKNVPIAITAARPGPAHDHPPRTLFDNLILYKNTFDLGNAPREDSRALHITLPKFSKWSSENAWLGFEPAAKDSDQAPPPSP